MKYIKILYKQRYLMIIEKKTKQFDYEDENYSFKWHKSSLLFSQVETFINFEV